jgi:hypothetical protein
MIKEHDGKQKNKMMTELCDWCRKHPCMRPSPFSLDKNEKELGIWYGTHIKEAENAIQSYPWAWE